MSQPNSMAEYSERFHNNNKIEGYGTAVKTIAPCPFCAASDWLCMPILDVEGALKKGATCKECGRSAKAIFKYENGDKSFEIVQTGGDDPPEWLQPKMRRVHN